MDTIIEIIVQNALYCWCGVYVTVYPQKLPIMSGTSIEGVLPVEVTPENAFFNL